MAERLEYWIILGKGIERCFVEFVFDLARLTSESCVGLEDVCRLAISARQDADMVVMRDVFGPVRSKGHQK